MCSPVAHTTHQLSKGLALLHRSGRSLGVPLGARGRASGEEIMEVEKRKKGQFITRE